MNLLYEAYYRHLSDDEKANFLEVMKPIYINSKDYSKCFLALKKVGALDPKEVIEEFLEFKPQSSGNCFQRTWIGPFGGVTVNYVPVKWVWGLGLIYYTRYQIVLHDSQFTKL
jgi:hypothetical protein